MPAFHPTPYTVNVRDLLHRPGDMRERDLDVTLVERFGEGAASVPAGSTVHIGLKLESLHDGVLVSAEIDTAATGECVRCLDPVAIPVEVEFQELFAYTTDEAFDFSVRDDHVDLEPVVRDAVVLSLPFQPVCRPDCPGLDPETGEKLDQSGARQPRAVADPRWSALEGFQAAEPDVSGAESAAREKR